MSLETLKRSLKDWEKQFTKDHDRKPSKADIKAHPDIESKYKEYKVLRYGGKEKPETRDHHHRSMHHQHFKDPSQKPVRSKEFVNTFGLRTPDKSSPDTTRSVHQSPAESPSKQVVELGPTPQLNGRLLGIFEESSGMVKTKTTGQSDFATPTKDVEGSPSVSRTIITLTPTAKRKIDFSEINSEDEDETSTIIVTPKKKPSGIFLRPSKFTKLTLDKYSTPTHNRILRSPVKTPNRSSPIKPIEMTPRYLSQGATVSIQSPEKSPCRSDDSNTKLISPSVFKYQNRITFKRDKGLKRRSLSEIFQEVEELKQKSIADDEQMKLEIASDLKEQQLLADIEREDMENGMLEPTDRFELTGDMGRPKNEFENELEDEKEESVSTAGDNVGPDDHKTAYWKKKKKVKRQTRRVKMKSRENFEEANITDNDEIVGEIASLKQRQLAGVTHLSTRSSTVSETETIFSINYNEQKEEENQEEEEVYKEEEIGEEEVNDSDEEYNAEDVIQEVSNSKSSGQAVINKNFKRYKLKKRGGGRFGRFRR
ncbi:hypothetical protein DASC09_026800 [Saccharomycopsis crataegensis]|uniref:DNA replication regulator SLD2 n=1 Tax=Saccharomycopsis crataegensis TaxID=43959 RepID=A0AAV5QLE6_9ASCO|nr:hypothetical protein DASC09_026800 [Saccharomycopsis crataegensis]